MRSQPENRTNPPATPLTGKGMLRWKEQEILLVTLVGACLLGAYLWQVHKHSAGQSDATFAAPFLANHTPFNIFRNVILPDIGMGLLIYLSYLYTNLVIIPCYWFPKKTFLRTIFHTLLWMALLTLLLGLALNTAIYYEHQWQFNYPGFSFFPQKGYNPNSQIDVSAPFAAAGFIIILYILYAALREAITRYLERPNPSRSYRIMIANQVTSFLAFYLALIPVGLIMHIFPESPLFIIYFALPSSAALVFVNLYWLFPIKGERSFLNRSVLLRVLLCGFICTFPVPIFFGFRAGFFFFFLSWAFQVFFVTPFAWLFYQQRKDKILQFRGLEKELVRSKADLQFLRSQINPHFLFNALNTLYGTALLENADQTAQGIQKLGDMMRFMLHDNLRDFIPLGREIEYLENYISLHKLRTQSSPGITIESNIRSEPEGTSAHHMIAPMLLIPFVENAFKHGISLNERSWIKINLDSDDRQILFKVSNSIHPRRGNDPEKENTGIGLKNVIHRLKLLYPGKFEFSAREQGNEFIVELSIQLV